MQLDVVVKKIFLESIHLSRACATSNPLSSRFPSVFSLLRRQENRSIRRRNERDDHFVILGARKRFPFV